MEQLAITLDACLDRKLSDVCKAFYAAAVQANGPSTICKKFVIANSTITIKLQTTKPKLLKIKLPKSQAKKGRGPRLENCFRCGCVIDTSRKQNYRRNSSSAKRKVYCLTCYEGLFI